MKIIEKLLNKLLGLGNSGDGYPVDVTSNDFHMDGSEFNYYVGTTGTTVVQFKNGNIVNMVGQGHFPNPIVKIYSAGTDSSNIVAFKV